MSQFTLTFKTPDVLDDVIQEHLDTHCENCEEYDPDCEGCLSLESTSLDKIEAIKNCAAKFIKYGEYISITFDTKTGTAIVNTVKK